MGFGPIDRPKELVLCELATTFARLLTRGGNRVGAILFDNEVEETLPPRSEPQPGARAHAEPAAAATRDERRGHRPDGGCSRRRAGRSAGDRSSSSSPTSSPRPDGSDPCCSSASGTRSSRSGSSTRASTSCPTQGVIVVEDAETGEQLVVDSSDAEFRHRLRAAGEAPRGRAARRDAPRGRRHLRGLDRRRPRHRPRPDRRVTEAATRR